MKKFLIDANVANAIGMYLMSRPMGEVEALVMELRHLQEWTPPPAPDAQKQPDDALMN
jgi:hypothetical protein